VIVPYPLAEVVNASGAEPDRAIWCDVDVKLTTGRIGLTGRTQATQLEYVVSPLAMSKLTNGHFLIGEINFHTPAGYVVVRSHKHQPNDRIAILYRCRSCSAKYDNDVGMLGMCRSCLLDKSIAAALADIEACGGTPYAMQANQESLRKLGDNISWDGYIGTRYGRRDGYIGTRYGRIKIVEDPGMPTNEIRIETLAMSPQALLEQIRAAKEYMRDLGERNAAPVAAAPPADPLDVEYDGVNLRDLIQWDTARRRETHPQWRQLTPAQRAAVSAHWSAQLRAKVAASKAAERNVVTYCEVDADE